MPDNAIYFDSGERPHAVPRRLILLTFAISGGLAGLAGIIEVAGPVGHLMPGISPEQAWEWATSTFREPVMRAEERAIKICFEPLAPTETGQAGQAACSDEP